MLIPFFCLVCRNYRIFHLLGTIVCRLPFVVFDGTSESDFFKHSIKRRRPAANFKKSKASFATEVSKSQSFVQTALPTCLRRDLNCVHLHHHQSSTLSSITASRSPGPADFGIASSNKLADSAVIRLVCALFHQSIARPTHKQSAQLKHQVPRLSAEEKTREKIGHTQSPHKVHAHPPGRS